MEKLEEERRALVERPRKRRRIDGSSPTVVVGEPSSSLTSGSVRATMEDVLDLDESDVEEVLELAERECTCAMEIFRFRF